MKPGFELHAPSHVLARPGAVTQAESVLAHAPTERILVIADQGIRDAGILADIREILVPLGGTVECLSSVPREPAVSDVEEVLGEVREFRPTLIVGVGGGSVLDTSKLMGVLTGGDQSLYELVEGASVGPRRVDTLLIPTTAGTGSEATKNAILSVPDRLLKVAIVAESLLPRYVILDAELTVSLPAATTATTGIDALAHALECYLSRKANDFSDALALRATRLIHLNLRRVLDNPSDVHARQSMLNASFLAGMCITLSGTTAVHALSYPLGATFHIPHGQANAMLLPAVMHYNAPACMEKVQLLADAVDVDRHNSPEKRSKVFIQSLEDLVDYTGIPRRLREFGVSAGDIPRLVETANGIRRLMDNNPREMTSAEMTRLYEGVL